MERFLYTSETVPDGLGFAQFGSFHLCWLAAIAVFTALMCIIYCRADRKRRERIRHIMALALIADELWKMVWLFIGGTYQATYLPLHLCSINIILIAVHAWRPSKTLDNFLYTFCLPAAVIALCCPTWTKLPPVNFMLLHSFTIHMLLAAYPLMLTVGSDIRPRLREVPKCLLLLVCLAIPIYGFNRLFGTNFMFLMSAPKGTPLVWFARHWGSHLWGFPILLPLVVALMHLPWLLFEKRRRPLRYV